MSKALFDNIKNDFLTFYKWSAEKQNRPGIKIWKTGKDDRALGLLIKYIREYYKQQNIKLDTKGVHKAARVWIKKAFLSAPEWIRKDGELAVMVSRFETVMESPDPDSEAFRIAQLQKEKKQGLKYNPHFHEVIPPARTGDLSSLGSILKSIAETNS